MQKMKKIKNKISFVEQLVNEIEERLEKIKNKQYGKN